MKKHLARLGTAFERFANRLSLMRIFLFALLFLVVEAALRLTFSGYDLNIIGLAGGCFIGLVFCQRRGAR